MPSNVVMRKVTVTGSYAKLSASSLVASVEISTPPDNAGNVLFKCADGSDVPWVPGEYHFFKSVDLSTIEVKGTPGDIVTIIGGTW
ncbi:MAG: hypothetical protein N3A38_12995 [Planctomycetota bacterium]|nr:hypothetical protein [Planctomycetota bacterium]